MRPSFWKVFTSETSSETSLLVLGLTTSNQVAVDVFQAKIRLRHLRRSMGKRRKGRRWGVGGAAQKVRAHSSLFSNQSVAWVHDPVKP